MKKLLQKLALALALVLLLLTACGQAPADKGGVQDNEYTLTRLRLSGRGDASEDYKVAFFEPETLEGVEAFLVFYSVEETEAVWDYLAALSYDEILALDKPVNRAYVITDLSYCDGVGNTLNTAQKDLVTGEPFSEAGEHRFYAATIGPDGLLALACAPQTVAIAPTAGELTFRQEGETLTGSFQSCTDGEIAENYLFCAPEGYAAVREQFTEATPEDFRKMAEDGSALAFDNAEQTDFTLDLGSLKLPGGEVWDGESCLYLYVASVSADKFLGLNYCDASLVTPADLPQSSGTVGDGQGILFPNGGAAPIGRGRGSIISASQAMFEAFPDTPRVAVLGGSSGSERELWSHFYQEDSSESFTKRFADAGVEAVYLPLTAENRDTIGEDPYFAALVASCHGVYFTGGDQSLGMTSLQRSDGSWNAVGEAVLDLFDRGGFLAGTSAGAHMLGDVCFQDADSHESLTHPVPTAVKPSEEGVLCGVEGALYEGLPCAKKAAGHSLVFDSHFGARGRLARLAVMQGASDADFAIGLDEATGLAISGGVGTVCGSGTVTILDRAGATYTGTEQRFGVKGLALTLLSPGDQFDFATGTVLPSAAKKPAGSGAEAEIPADLLGGDSAQTRALITLALSGEAQMDYPLATSTETLTATVRRTGDFAAFCGQRTYRADVLSDLPQTTVTGWLLDIQ